MDCVADVLEEQATTPERSSRFEEEEDTEGWKTTTKPTLPPLSALQRAFFAPPGRAGALSLAHVEPRPQQLALPQPLSWAQKLLPVLYYSTTTVI